MLTSSACWQLIVHGGACQCTYGVFCSCECGLPCDVPETGPAGRQVRFILMNSFSTSDDTREFLGKAHGELLAEEDSELIQNKSPKIDAKTLEPASYRDQEWCAGTPLAA